MARCARDNKGAAGHLRLVVSFLKAGPVLVPAADAGVSAELGLAFLAQDIKVHADTLTARSRRWVT